MKRFLKRLAFTLVELLVVISILGVLAALMFPMISKMREKARQAQCANNLKELSTAVSSYVGDHGGRYPWSTTHQYLDENNVWKERKGWVGKRSSAFTPGIAGFVDMWDDTGLNGTACVTNGALFSYVNEKRIYLCPTFAIELKKVKPTGTPIRSYVMNWTMSYKNFYSLTDGSRRLLFTELNTAKVVEGLSVSTYCVTDADQSLPASTATTLYYLPRTTDGQIYCTTSTVPPSEAIGAYHNGKGHAVFADGHIEFIYYSNTWDACTGNW